MKGHTRRSAIEEGTPDISGDLINVNDLYKETYGVRPRGRARIITSDGSASNSTPPNESLEAKVSKLEEENTNVSVLTGKSKRPNNMAKYGKRLFTLVFDEPRGSYYQIKNETGFSINNFTDRINHHVKTYVNIGQLFDFIVKHPEFGIREYILEVYTDGYGKKVVDFYVVQHPKLSHAKYESVAVFRRIGKKDIVLEGEGHMRLVGDLIVDLSTWRDRVDIPLEGRPDQFVAYAKRVR